MKHKVGDIVRVKSKEWYENYKNPNISTRRGSYTFVRRMSYYLGKNLTIARTYENFSFYLVKEDEGEFYWTDEMFED
jgi:hypothetical protein